MEIPEAREKSRLYQQAADQVATLVGGEVDGVARMAGVVAVLHGTMPHFFWTGFYRVVGAELVIGPYQGTPGCARIAWGRGVCGTAWETGATQVVADVHAFPGHIACDAASASEIVVPVGYGRGVTAVLDVDSTAAAAFGDADAAGLGSVLAAAGWRVE